MLEAPISNVWWRTGETLCTPSIDVGVLAGVTRATMLELAPAAGYRVDEGAFVVDELRAADEAFTSSSIREVIPVVELDGRPIGDGKPGEAARALQGALRRVACDGSDEKIRLGGMALANGVLVHGPTSWACAVRTPDGELKVVAERKRLVASGVASPLSARAGAARRVVRVPAAPAAPAAGGEAAVRAPARDRGDAAGRRS